MKSETPRHYFRISRSCNRSNLEGNEISIDLPDGMVARIRPGYGVVFGDLDEHSGLASVSDLSVVKGVDFARGFAKAVVSETNVTLKPNKAGYQYWRKPFFRFADSVAARYGFDDLFAEHFPEYSGMTLRPDRPVGTATNRQYLPVAGYVYVIRSDYGFKIGKTINIKDRVKLFSVKLPFPISLESYAWFENYSEAESNLHRQFGLKRTEGEWFKLNGEDLAYIKSQGKQVSIEGL